MVARIGGGGGEKEAALSCAPPPPPPSAAAAATLLLPDPLPLLETLPIVLLWVRLSEEVLVVGIEGSVSLSSPLALNFARSSADTAAASDACCASHADSNEVCNSAYTHESLTRRKRDKKRINNYSNSKKKSTSLMCNTSGVEKGGEFSFTSWLMSSLS
jgi:hypothetical protein